MLNKLLNELKALPMSDKITAGVSVGVLANPSLAIFAAVIVLTYYIYTIGKKLVP